MDENPEPVKGKILCGDDDEDVLRVLDVMFRNYGYDTVLAHDGGEALDMYMKHKDSLVTVVLDLRMPVMDGFEVAKGIRKDSKDIPVIALSAYLGGPERDSIPIKRCEEAGFSAYTRKPFAIDQFLMMVDESVAQYRVKRGI